MTEIHIGDSMIFHRSSTFQKYSIFKSSCINLRNVYRKIFTIVVFSYEVIQNAHETKLEDFFFKLTLI